MKLSVLWIVIFVTTVAVGGDVLADEKSPAAAEVQKVEVPAAQFLAQLGSEVGDRNRENRGIAGPMSGDPGSMKEKLAAAKDKVKDWMGYHSKEKHVKGKIERRIFVGGGQPHHGKASRRYRPPPSSSSSSSSSESRERARRYHKHGRVLNIDNY